MIPSLEQCSLRCLDPSWKARAVTYDFILCQKTLHKFLRGGEPSGSAEGAEDASAGGGGEGECGGSVLSKRWTLVSRPVKYTLLRSKIQSCCAHLRSLSERERSGAASAGAAEGARGVEAGARQQGGGAVAAAVSGDTTTREGSEGSGEAAAAVAAAGTMFFCHSSLP